MGGSWSYSANPNDYKLLVEDDIRREAQTMSLIDHSNVIRPYCSFVVDHNLWIVMPFMSEGSCLHLMKSAYPGGFEEPAIGSVLKETLKALDYLHRQGHIYRDVKEIDKVLEIPLLGLLAGWHQRSCSLEVDITPSMECIDVKRISCCSARQIEAFICFSAAMM